MVDVDSIQCAVSTKTTNIQMTNVKIEWSIAEFGNLMKLVPNGQHIQSRKFSAIATNSDIVCELRVYSNGQQKEDANGVTIVLDHVGKLQKGSIKAEVTLSLNSPLASQVWNLYNGVVGSVHNSPHRFGSYKLEHEKFSNWLNLDGNLIIVCNIIYLPQNCNHDEKVADNAIFDEECSLNYLHKTLDPNLFPDFAIKVGENMFNCHKCILASHSIVFRRTLEQMMTKEAHDGFFEIVNSSQGAVKSLLEFMYTGQIKNLHEHAQELLVISEKYDLSKSKELCEKQLISNLTFANVCQFLVLADTHSATSLKCACIKFLLKNHKQIIESKQWKTLQGLNPSLSNNVLKWILKECKGSLDMGWTDFSISQMKEDTALLKLISITGHCVLVGSLMMFAAVN